MNTVKEVLQAVDDLLSDESKWCKEYPARDVEGLPASSLDNDAVCWCLAGALSKVSLGQDYNLFLKTLDFLSKQIPGEKIIPWNDAYERTFQDVKNVLAQAKEKAQ